jgi:hypothetical protein
VFGRFVFFKWGVTKLPVRTQALRKLDELTKLLPSLEWTGADEQFALTTMVKHLRNRMLYRPDKHAPKEDA